MPRIVRTARGVQLDFDTIIIKNQLSQAPMNIEVARRKEFIDSKEGKSRSKAVVAEHAEVIESPDEVDDLIVTEEKAEIHIPEEKTVTSHKKKK